MHPNDIKKLIEDTLPDSQALVSSPDNVHFSATVISAAFADKSRVQRQQMIYQILQTLISSGEIHALSLKTYTLEESTKS